MIERQKETYCQHKAKARSNASPAKKQKEKDANKEQMAQARATASPAKTGPNIAPY